MKTVSKYLILTCFTMVFAHLMAILIALTFELFNPLWRQADITFLTFTWAFFGGFVAFMIGCIGLYLDDKVTSREHSEYYKNLYTNLH